jgi:hypothetical protein
MHGVGTKKKVHLSLSLGTVTTLLAGNPRNRPSISGKGRRFLPSLNLPNLLWFPSSLLFNVYWKRLLKHILKTSNQKKQRHSFHPRISAHIRFTLWMSETKITTNVILQYAAVIYWL